MGRFIILLLLAIFSLISNGQNSYTCGYSSSKEISNCDFIHKDASIGEKNVHEVVNSIVEKVALPKNFILVKCSETYGSPAMAFCSNEGIRYITINEKWINQLNSTSWLTIGVLAHEIGHHLSGHTTNYFHLTLEERRKQELEADKFSGYIMSSLGASFEQALLGINYFIPKEVADDFSTHPSRNKRINAIKDGFGINKLNLNNDGFLSYEHYYNIGIENIKNENYEKALLNFSRAKEIKPNSTHVWHKLGYIFEILENKDSAINAYIKATEIDNKNSDSWHNLGLLYIDRKDYTKSINALEEATKLKSDAISYDYLAYSYYMSLNQEKACLNWKKACDLGESNACKYFNHTCFTNDEIYLDEILLIVNNNGSNIQDNYKMIFFEYKDYIVKDSPVWSFNVGIFNRTTKETISSSYGQTGEINAQVLESLDDGTLSNYYSFDWNFENSYNSDKGTCKVFVDLFKFNNTFKIRMINKDTKKEYNFEGYFIRPINN